MIHRLARAVLAALLVIAADASVGPPVAGAAGRFDDIAESRFRADIEWLADQGITSGCDERRFCPDGIVTRAQMASFLARFLALPAPSVRDVFDDDDGSRHESNIDRLAASGITAGCGGRSFCPDGTVTRGQMASFLVRALGLRHGGASDLFDDDDASKHRGAIDRLAAARITAGCGERRFCPNGTVTRGQMAAFLRRASGLRSPAPVAGLSELGPSVSVTLPVGRIIGHRWDHDFAAPTSTADVILRTPQRVSADARARIGGQEHHRIRGGSFDGHWIPTLDGVGLRAGTPLPTCAVADEATRYPAYADWQRTLVDLTFMVPAGYVPPDLVKATSAGVDHDSRYGIPYVRRVVMADLTAMAGAARAAGVHLRVNSAYRSYDTQLAELLGEGAWFESAVRSKGYQEALLYTNRAGHSEHQLGTTLDLEPYVFPGTHAWLTRHAWSYGFLLSYPEGRNTKHCYGTEIWHYRYFGREVAAEIRASGLSPREWLWYVEHQ